MAGMFNDGSHFRELDVGESTSFRTTVKAKDLFASPGSYELSAIYLPEPNRAFTKVQDAIVFENGPVASGAVKIKVVA
jgi:hypothetical protein